MNCHLHGLTHAKGSVSPIWQHWGNRSLVLRSWRNQNVSFQTPNQLFNQLNDIVFIDPTSTLSRGSSADEIYRKGLRHYAEEFTRNLPMEPEDLLEQVYLEFVNKIKRGWVPHSNLRNAFISTLRNRSIDVFRQLPKQPVADAVTRAQALQRLDPVKHQLEIEALLSEYELLEQLTPQWDVEDMLNEQANGAESIFDDGSQWSEIEVKCAVSAEALANNFRDLSGALTWMTISGHNGIDLDDAPTPKAGVGSDQIFGWPSLWFATHDRSLFDQTASKAEVRKRQRQMSAIDNLRLAAQSNVAKQLGAL